MASGLITILFTDLVGSTEHASDARRRRGRRAAPRPLRVAARGGRRDRRHRGEDDRRRADGLVPGRGRRPRRARRPCSGRSSATTARLGEGRDRDARRHQRGRRDASRTATGSARRWSRRRGSARRPTAGRSSPATSCARSPARRTELELRPLGDARAQGPARSARRVRGRLAARRPGRRDQFPLPAFVDTDPAFPFAGRVDQLDGLIADVEGNRRRRAPRGARVGRARHRQDPARHRGWCAPRTNAGAIVLWGRCDEELGVPVRTVRRGAAPLRRRDAARPAARRARSARRRARAHRARASRRASRASPSRCAADADTERFRLFDSVDRPARRDVGRAPGRARARRPALGRQAVARCCSATCCARRRRCACSCSATYRDTDLDRSHPLSDVLADLRRQPGVERLDLQGLDEDEITGSWRSTAGHDLDRAGPRSRACALRNETEGNPFFVGEVLRHLAESGVIVADTTAAGPPRRRRRLRHPRGHPRGRRPAPLAPLRRVEPGARGRAR